MKNRKRILCLAAVVCLLTFTGTSALAEDADLEQIFTDMTVEELTEADTLLESILNEKKIAGATLSFPDGDVVLAKGKSTRISPVCEGRELTAKVKIAYTSSDETVATANGGNVSGKGAGTAIITASATFEDGAVLTAECRVTVIVPVSAVKAQNRTADVLVGSETELAGLFTVAPADATQQGLVFSCEENDVITLTESGTVTGLKAGSVTVTATSAEETDKPKKATITVTVGQPVTALSIDGTGIKVGKGRTGTIPVTVGPEDASNKNLEWTSSDPKIATVNAKGVVTGVGTGTATISCATTDGTGLQAETSVEVITAVSSVRLSAAKGAVTLGKTVKLQATVQPKDATNQRLKWSSSSTSIATVSEDGTVTGVKTGTCTITATTTDGTEKSVSYALTVEPKNPVMIDQISWRTVWGFKNGKVKFEIQNNCSYRTIKSVSVKIVCTGSYGTKTSYEDYSVTIAPGKSKYTKLRYLGGFTSAYTVQVTPYSVTYNDGTTELIDESAQYTSTFSM